MTETVLRRRAPRPAHRRMPARHVAACVALGVGLAIVAQLVAAGTTTTDAGQVRGAWHPPVGSAERVVAKMDGAAFAQTARDPLMRRAVADYQGDRVDAAYRASRPATGWLYWAGSLGGQRALLAPVILLVTALTAGAAVLALDRLRRALGLPMPPLGAIAAFPAFVASMAYPGICEPLGLTLSLLGLSAWTRGRRGPAVVLFAVAALTRETMLLVPLGLALDLLVRERRLRPALPLLIPPAVYVAWVGVVYLRIGALPTGYSPMVAPLSGLATAVPHWHLAEWATAALFVVAGAAIVRWGTGWMRAILVVHLLFFTTMVDQVWWVWWGFGRVGTAIPLLGLLAWSARSTEHPAPARAQATTARRALVASA